MALVMARRVLQFTGGQVELALADSKSIAVLPFSNMSDDKDNAYSADGMQEELLTQLALLGELKVVSRTSVMDYRDSKKNVRQIGTELGVSFSGGGQCAPGGRCCAGVGAADRCDFDQTPMGEQLRTEAERHLRHPE